MKKTLILNADDLGLSQANNNAVLSGYQFGLLQHASLIVNTDGFEDAIQNVIQKCPNLNIGIHLNIFEGKALTNCPFLTDTNKNFNHEYLYFLINQFNKSILMQIENEFRAQIEKALQNNIEIKRIDSHVHIHSIPEIFKITCNLAKEYNIEYVRTQFEIPYLVFPQCLSLKFLINIIKICILNFCTLFNKKIINKYNLKTNDNIIGVGYTSMMNRNTIIDGVKAAKNGTIEAVIHPCLYNDNRTNSLTQEYQITQDECLKAKFLNKK